MKQTAVEWYQKAILEILKQKENLSDEMFLQNMLNAYLQSKEMEKKNLYNFYTQGGVDAIMEADRNAEQYYNKTFKSE